MRYGFGRAVLSAWLLLEPANARSPGPWARTRVFVANVADAATLAALPDAEVSIPAISRSARTNWLGEVTLADVPAGDFRVRVCRIGYVPADVLIRFSRDTVGYVFMLEPAPVGLDTMRTSATKHVPLLLQEFETRRRMAIGRFLTDSVFHAEPTQPLARILEAHLPGFRAADMDRTVMRFNCGTPDLYINGFRSGGTRGPDPTDLRTVVGADVAGVEYYTSASAPVQYRRLSASRCGVLLIWLKP